VCIGLANYGYYYQASSRARKARFPAKHRPLIYHNQMAALLAAGWTETFDNQALAPYYFSPDKATLSASTIPSASTIKCGGFHSAGIAAFSGGNSTATSSRRPGTTLCEHPLIDHVEAKIRGYSR
jgi:hypothetical protein